MFWSQKSTDDGYKDYLLSSCLACQSVTQVTSSFLYKCNKDVHIKTSPRLTVVEIPRSKNSEKPVLIIKTFLDVFMNVDKQAYPVFRKY